MKTSNILRALTIREWAVVVVIVLVLLALLVPNVRWVADGERSHPVRVFVFDASNDRPIVGARVTIFHAAPLSSVETMSKPLKGIATERYGNSEDSITASDGCAVLKHRFKTSTSSRRPTPHIHLCGAWVEVRAEGYGGAVVPVRHESRPTADVLRESELLVPIGLHPVRR